MGADAKPDIGALFEKLHLHELEVRERVSARLQLSLSVFVGLSGATAFLAQNFNRESTAAVVFIFWFLLTATTVGLLVMGFFVVRGLFGHEYEEVPLANAISDHLDTIESQFGPYDAAVIARTPGTKCDTVSEEIVRYLRKEFAARATANARINDKRAEQAHCANGTAIATTLTTFIAFAVLIFGGIQKGGPTAVEVAKPVQVNVVSMPVNVTATNSSNQPEGATSNGRPKASISTTNPATPIADPTAASGDQRRLETPSEPAAGQKALGDGRKP